MKRSAAQGIPVLVGEDPSCFACDHHRQLSILNHLRCNGQSVPEAAKPKPREFALLEWYNEVDPRALVGFGRPLPIGDSLGSLRCESIRV